MPGGAGKLCALLSTLLLVYPAFFAARYGTALHRLSSLKDTTADEREILDVARAELRRRRDSWTPLHNLCLFLGTGLAVLANAVDLIASLCG